MLQLCMYRLMSKYIPITKLKYYNDSSDMNIAGKMIVNKYVLFMGLLC
jgi:hypothetical protein